MNDIINRARELNICDEWYGKMCENPQMRHFCVMYFRGDDWALENDFPTLDLLRKYKGETEEFGLYTDYKGIFINPNKLAFFGSSRVELEYNAFGVGYLNIRHDSKAKIKVKDNAILVINILDNAEVEIDAEGGARVSVYQYSDKAKVEGKGAVRIRARKFK